MPTNKKTFISFNDTTVPVGKRKMLYVKWLMSKQGKTLNEAKLAAYRKFGNPPDHSNGYDD
jgi:hypothetical protein